MRNLALFLFFLGALKICWAQPSDDICICELENSAAFSFYESDASTVVVNYPTESIYTVFSFTTNSEEEEEEETPVEEKEKPIYGSIPEDNGMASESGAEVDRIAEEVLEPEVEEELDAEEIEPVVVAEREPETGSGGAVGSSGGASRTKQARVDGSRAKQKRYGNKRIGSSQQTGRVRLKRKRGVKKYKGKCPSF